MSAVNEVTCKTAEDLLTELHWSNKLWNGNRQFWVFRGHSDDTHELIPTALREVPKPKLGYTYALEEGRQPSNEKQIDAEFKRLCEFFWAIDAQGLFVPGDSKLFRTPKWWDELEQNIQNDGWPVDDLLPLLALAQHYGVPTRLLDWSNNCLVAAYFAAKEHVMNGPKGEYISVWALNLEWVIHTAFPSRNSPMSIYVVSAPRGSNPNLHAQEGIFTTEKLTKDDLSKEVDVRSVDKIVDDKWRLLNCTKPVMSHFRLPSAEANKLLRLLNQEGINSATLFPGYQGVADSLKEREHWDSPERTTYWIAEE